MAKVYLKRIIKQGCDGCYFYGEKLDCSRPPWIKANEKDKYNGDTCSLIPCIYIQVFAPEAKINV